MGKTSSISSTRRCSRRFYSLTEMEHQEASQQHESDLLAFENRYKEADADRFASFPNTSAQKVHASIVREQYGRWKPNTKRTFDVFRESWTGFCERNNYDRKETTVERGEEFLQAERARHLEAGSKTQERISEKLSRSSRSFAACKAVPSSTILNMRTCRMS